MNIHEFIKTIAPIVQEECAKRGYPFASPIIAQALIESEKSTGLSKLASNYNNFFGMKCGAGWTGKSVNLSTAEEYSIGVLTQIKSNFRVYSSVIDGVKGYFEFIKYSRYSNLKQATSPEDYLRKIVADGYCTSSTYVATGMGKIRKYDLTQYDMKGESLFSDEKNNVVYAEYFMVGKVYTLNASLYVRDAANGKKKKFSQLTASAKASGTTDINGYAILKAGTRVTCQEVKKLSTTTWLRIPSGWICAVNSDGEYYIK